MKPRRFVYDSMGTRWAVTVWDAVPSSQLDALQADIVGQSEAFDRAYSRFLPDSLVCRLASRTGTVEVPRDLVVMLRWYERLYAASQGACTPLVGDTLDDLGYDPQYSLVAKPVVRPVPPLPDTVRILDDTHIELRSRALLDLGALGKGYFVDRIVETLDAAGLTRFLVDGSGDIFCRGDEPVRAGLEHPDDPSKAIGVLAIANAALCASGGNRRAWGGRHHIIDPVSLASPEGIAATWVLADSTVLADALATCLFLCPPERFSSLGPFEYCLLSDAGTVKRSAGFRAELF